MKLSTIWTIPAMSLRERFRQTGEWAVRGIAHRLPRKLAYWSFIDSGARYIRDDQEVPAVGYCDVLEEFGKEVRAV